MRQFWVVGVPLRLEVCGESLMDLFLAASQSAVLIASWPELLIAIGTFIGLLAGFIHRETILGWFRRGAGPHALAETLKTIEALEGRVNFLSEEIARMKEENALLRRENDTLREMVTSRAAISELTASIEKLSEAGRQQHQIIAQMLEARKI